MSNENDKEHALQLNRQAWEPAGVVSVKLMHKKPARVPRVTRAGHDFLI